MHTRRDRTPPAAVEPALVPVGGRRSIEHAATSTAAFVGTFTTGPLDTAVACHSLTDVEKVFGGLSGDPSADATTHGVRQFFTNGGRDALIVRVEQADAVGLEGDEAAGTGVHALRGDGSFSILCIPGAVQEPMGPRGTAQVYAAAIAVCEEERAMLLVDTPAGLAEPGALENWLRAVRPVSPDAAAYFPRVELPDPQRPGQHHDLAPSGAVAGIFARTDRDRGVWKAPAGVEAALWGVDHLTVDLPDDDVATLSGLGVNPLRHLAGDVAAVWGARTTASGAGSEWRYVPVRRTASFIGKSLERGLQWTAAEKNDLTLRSSVTTAVTEFLEGLFRGEAFQGSSSREAYFVRCDASTTTQSDIDDGRLNVILGFAALHPAEFVIVRTTHRTLAG